MIPEHPYIAMLLTGSLHIILGVSGVVIGIVAGTGDTSLIVNTTLFTPVFSFAAIHHRSLYGVAILCSLWVILVGCLGISAGFEKFEDRVIRGLKNAYMVTAILSACVFSLVGSVMFSLINPAFSLLYGPRYYSVAIGGLTVMSIEFVLAIVTASICCCCNCCSRHSKTELVYPAPIMPTVHTVQTFGQDDQPPTMHTYYGVKQQPQGTQGFSEVHEQPWEMQKFSRAYDQPRGMQKLPRIPLRPLGMQSYDEVHNQIPKYYRTPYLDKNYPW